MESNGSSAKIRAGATILAASESVAPDTSEVPDWGFSIDRLTDNPENVRVRHGSRTEICKVVFLCHGFLLDKFGYEKNILSTDSELPWFKERKLLRKGHKTVLGSSLGARGFEHAHGGRLGEAI